MNIGIIISRIGGEDGVALETEKWIDVLKEMGHEAFLVSGEFEGDVLDKTHQRIIPELSIISDDAWEEHRRIFYDLDKNIEGIIKNIKEKSDSISEKIVKWTKEKKIDILISENASSLPFNLSMSVGIKKAIEVTGIKTISHNHDFYWERGNHYISPHEKINKIVNETIPLRLPNVVNVVINTSAKKILEDKYNLSNVFVLPNVMDFDEEYKPVSSKKEFLEKFGLNKDNIVLLQPTRIVKRKGIETAIKLVHELNDKKVKLLVTGKCEDNGGREYYETLISLIKDLGLTDQVIFVDDKINSFALFDLYYYSNSCTYFSIYEGFGNAFIEAVFLKKPIFVNNYKPIFSEDIGNKGFKVIMTEDNVLTEKIVKKIKEVIYNENLKKEIGEHNFKLGKKYFSYYVLKKGLKRIFSEVKS